MVSVLPDVTNTWSVRTYLYAASCGSGSRRFAAQVSTVAASTLETCLKDQVRAYPGLRVDVATNVDHVFEGLCVGRRHGQLRVAMGTVRRDFPSTSRGADRARVSGLQGFRGSRGSPQEAHREERCAQHAAHPKRLNARLCSPSAPATRRGDQRGRRRNRLPVTRIAVGTRPSSFYSFYRRLLTARRNCNR